MEVEIENAINIAGNPAADASLKQQAFDYVVQLRSNGQAWPVIVTLFTRSEPRASEIVRLFALELVNNAIFDSRHDQASLLFFKDAIFRYVRDVYGPSQRDPAASAYLVDPSHIQNKLCQSLTYLFVFLYQQGWESFISDFLALLSSSSASSSSPSTANSPSPAQPDNMAGVVLYLRLLSSLHDEIADVVLARGGGNSGDAKRNSDLKDRLRVQDNAKIAHSWETILAYYHTQSDDVVNMVLKVVGKWVSWMDISLVIGGQILNLMLPLLSRPGVRPAAVETMSEIVAKKMKTGDKMELLEFLHLSEIVQSLMATIPVSESKTNPDYDADFVEVVAKLVNTVVSDIVYAMDDSAASADDKARADKHLQDFVPCLLRFLSDDYDDVSAAMIPSVTELLAVWKKHGNAMPAHHREILPRILEAVIAKMRYDDEEESSWADDDAESEEAEFDELRKKLQILQKAMAAIDMTLYMDTVHVVIRNAFQSLEKQGPQRINWRDMDLALHELYLFGEVALAGPATAKHATSASASANQPATQHLSAMVKLMVESEVSNIQHPAILIQYMEICVRYAHLIESQPDLIQHVLKAFIRLIHVDHVRIKTRSWYLFARFVKQVRQHVRDLVEHILAAMADLLQIRAEAPREVGEDDASDAASSSSDALFQSQLYLFEAMSYLAAMGATASEKAAMIRRLMEAIFADLEKNLPAAQQQRDGQAIAQIHHGILALGALAPGFNESPAAEVVGEFVRSAEVIVVALGQLSFSTEIRQASRSSFSRILNVVGADILPQLPRWIDGLMSGSSRNDEIAFFLRLLGQVVYNFKTEVYQILDMLLMPLLQRVHTGLCREVSGTDEALQLGELRREYLAFILVLLNNDLAGVLISERNQAFLETLISSVLSIARLLDNNIPQSRLGFSAMARMATLWGGPSVAEISQQPSEPSDEPQPVIPGFDRFLLDRFHTLAWDVLGDALFRPDADAQMRQLLTEIAAMEQAIYVKTGRAFLAHLNQVPVVPRVAVPGHPSASSHDLYLRALTTSKDKKVFATALLPIVRAWRQ